ncbi:MAG: CpsB/CapC family capsule biosynthesis tyrosine phosphatase [Polyangiaceae bacterium]
MAGYIDLHCHWVAGIDDGAKTPADSLAMLRALAEVGFSQVMATPHMRTGMFDNQRRDLEEAYARTVAALDDDLPIGGLASEHHLDDLVFQELLAGNGLPYPPGHAALIEFPNERFPLQHARCLFDLRRQRIRPVLAHPERYRPVWEDIHALDAILDGGTVLLLDVAALVGKYGRRPEKTARRLLEEGYYYAACSDAHRARDAEEVAAGIDELRRLMGEEEVDFLFREGPRRILDGMVED